LKECASTTNGAVSLPNCTLGTFHSVAGHQVGIKSGFHPEDAGKFEGAGSLFTE